MTKSFRKEIDEILDRWGYGDSKMVRRLKLAGPDFEPRLSDDATSLWNMLDMASKVARAADSSRLERALIRLSRDFNRVAMAGSLYTEGSKRNAMAELVDALGDLLKTNRAAKNLFDGLNWEDIDKSYRKRRP